MRQRQTAIPSCSSTLSKRMPSFLSTAFEALVSASVWAITAFAPASNALPARFVAMQAARHDLISAPVPVPLPRYNLNLVASRAALMDEGVAWMAEQVNASVSSA